MSAKVNWPLLRCLATMIGGNRDTSTGMFTSLIAAFSSNQSLRELSNPLWSIVVVYHCKHSRPACNVYTNSDSSSKHFLMKFPTRVHTDSGTRKARDLAKSVCSSPMYGAILSPSCCRRACMQICNTVRFWHSTGSNDIPVEAKRNITDAVGKGPASLWPLLARWSSSGAGAECMQVWWASSKELYPHTN